MAKKKNDSVTYRAIKCRLYPTEKQKEFFMKTFGCCRKVYNLLLEDSIAYYEETGKHRVENVTKYKEEYPFLCEVESRTLAYVTLDLSAAFSKFFKEPAVGFPKYKSRKNSKFSYTTDKIKVSIDKKYIKVPKLGLVKIKLHREPKENWGLKKTTISMASDGEFYASLCYEFVSQPCDYSVNTDNSIALKYKSDGLYMDNFGNVGSNHKYYRESEEKLAKEQRKLSHMIESHVVGYKNIGGKRYPVYDKPIEKCKNIQKQKLRVAKIHTHIANQRKDNLHKLSTEIANRYDIVCVESLNMKEIAKRDWYNGKATLDNGYGMFLTMLDYKLSERGKVFVRVDKFFPSTQICENCGYVQKVPLHKKRYNCPKCHNGLFRHQNAAQNILSEGLKMLQEQ